MDEQILQEHRALYDGLLGEQGAVLGRPVPTLTDRASLQFAFSNSFSGQVLEESWTLTFYNVVFTVLPPFVLGVFDQFVGARMLDRYPELYKLGQQNRFVSRLEDANTSRR